MDLADMTLSTLALAVVDPDSVLDEASWASLLAAAADALERGWVDDLAADADTVTFELNARGARALAAYARRNLDPPDSQA